MCRGIRQPHPPDREAGEHVCGDGIVALVGVLVLTIAGCVTPSTAPTMAPPSVDVRGNWVGRWSFENPAAGGGEVMLELRQTGADVSGNATVTDRTGPRSVTLPSCVIILTLCA